jgi:hypothetical protein
MKQPLEIFSTDAGMSKEVRKPQPANAPCSKEESLQPDSNFTVERD